MRLMFSHLSAGNGILKVARMVGCGSGTVQRVKREMAEDLVEADVDGHCAEPASLLGYVCDQDRGQPMQAMTLELPRRGFIAGLCAATAKAALTPATAMPPAIRPRPIAAPLL